MSRAFLRIDASTVGHYRFALFSPIGADGLTGEEYPNCRGPLATGSAQAQESSFARQTTEYWQSDNASASRAPRGRTSESMRRGACTCSCALRTSPTPERRCYLLACSRFIVGWAVSAVNDRHLTIKALEMAVKRRAPEAGLLHHSDQGCTYASEDYQAILDARGGEADGSRGQLHQVRSGVFGGWGILPASRGSRACLAEAIGEVSAKAGSRVHRFRARVCPGGIDHRPGGTPSRGSSGIAQAARRSVLFRMPALASVPRFGTLFRGSTPGPHVRQRFADAATRARMTRAVVDRPSALLVSFRPGEWPGRCECLDLSAGRHSSAACQSPPLFHGPVIANVMPGDWMLRKSHWPSGL